ncbi:Polyol transporter like [Quillaja saponaria]|uniref:Polyol transporter like n=1 Tax=Quillaja saponaria TaxID=32244 RepID=A0AAD7KQQ6_QUISA|nr:Polyol transporter like [Quillaja saponaria]
MEEGNGESKESQTGFNKYACICVIFASIISLIYGYDVGVMGGAMIYMQEDLKISDTQVGILAGIINLCALPGSLSAGRFADYIGRRYTFVLASVIFFLGSILMGYGPSYAILMDWKVHCRHTSIPSLTLAIGMLKMPESPRWLVMQGRLGEANEVLLQVQDKSRSGQGVWKELLWRPSPPVRWMLIAAIGLHFFQHTAGIEAVLLFSPRILKKAGINNKSKLLLATVGIGITKTVFILVATYLLDKVGRRVLLLTSLGGMIVALTGLGFCLTMVEHSNETLYWVTSLSISATYIYMGFYSIGVGPVSWVYSSEIFPLRLRAQGFSICVAVSRFMNAAVSMSFILIYKAITIGGIFFMFAGISVVAGWFFYFFLPETKGRSLEEMETIFGKKSSSQNLEMPMKPAN